jgi:hypothetical protein
MKNDTIVLFAAIGLLALVLIKRKSNDDGEERFLFNVII